MERLLGEKIEVTSTETVKALSDVNNSSPRDLIEQAEGLVLSDNAMRKLKQEVITEKVEDISKAKVSEISTQAETCSSNN